MEYLCGGAKPDFRHQRQNMFCLMGSTCLSWAANSSLDSSRAAMGVGEGGCSSWETSHQWRGDWAAQPVNASLS